MQIVNSLDPEFFEANIPEAFSARKNAHAEQHQKVVEVLPFFYNVITKSNMISEGKHRSLAHQLKPAF